MFTIRYNSIRIFAAESRIILTSATVARPWFRTRQDWKELVMRRILASLVLGGALAATAGMAAAGGNVSFGISVGIPAPVYVGPPVAYYPRPVYVAPPPVYVAPPVYYAPAPIYYGPPVVHRRWHHHHRHHGHGHYRHR
jgi:hypothetical protein